MRWIAVTVVLGLAACGGGDDKKRDDRADDRSAIPVEDRRAHEETLKQRAMDKLHDAEVRARHASEAVAKLQDEYAAKARDLDVALSAFKSAKTDDDRKAAQAVMDKLNTERKALAERIAATKRALADRLHRTSSGSATTNP